MPRKDDDWEKEAVLETVRRHAADPAVNNKDFARRIWKNIIANQVEVRRLLALTGQPLKDFNARLEDAEDTGIYGLLDTMVKKGYGAGPLNLKLLTWFVEDDKEFALKVDAVHEDIKVRRNYPDIFTVQRLHDDESEGVLDFAHTLQGRYVFYRPFYFDYANQLMRLALTIGNRENLFFVNLEHKYDATKYDREQEDYSLQGTLAPLPGKTRAVINLADPPGEPRSGGHQTLYVDFIEIIRGRAQIMTGVSLSAIGPSPATAWPFYARKLKDDEVIKPGIISIKSKELTAMAKQKFSLGFVGWQPKNIT